MKSGAFALILPAIFLLGSAQLAAQEHDQERMPGPAAQQDACEVTFYTVESDDMRGHDMRTDRPGEYGQETRPGVGQQARLDHDLPLRGEQVTSVSVQEEPLTLWAEFSPGLDQPQSVRVDDQQTGVELNQALAVQVLQTDEAIARDPGMAPERDERIGEEQERIEHAGRTPGMATEATEAALIQLNTSRASQGQLQVTFEGAMEQCTGSLQVSDRHEEDFRRDEGIQEPEDRTDDPFDPEPEDDDPFDPEADA